MIVQLLCLTGVQQQNKCHPLGEVEDCHQFAPETLGRFEAFRVEDDLSDEVIVWLGHGHWTEELLQIVRELGAATVTFACRVHGDEDAGVVVNVDLRNTTGNLKA